MKSFAIAQAKEIGSKISIGGQSKSEVGVFHFAEAGCQEIAKIKEQLDQMEADLRAIQEAKLLGGSTNFDRMVETVLENFSHSTLEHKYVILMTNGEGTKSKDSNGKVGYTPEDVAELSNRLKEHGIRIIPVAINEECTEAERAEPDRLCPADTLSQWAYDDEASNGNQVYSMLSKSTPRLISDLVKRHLQEDADDCGGGQPQPPQPKPEPRCNPADVTILVDSSDSITSKQWQQQLDAIQDWMSGYWQDSPMTQITVKHFSDDVRSLFGPGNSEFDANWRDTMRNHDQMAQDTNLYKALEHVLSDEYKKEREDHLRNYNGDELDQRHKILFVLSDGWATDTGLGDLASGVNTRFDIIVAVGVGNEVDLSSLKDTINSLSFNTAQVEISHVTEYRQLAQKIPNIRQSVCNIQHRMALVRSRRYISNEKADRLLQRKKRQNRGPRPDMMNFTPECDESGFCDCKCTVPITEARGYDGDRGQIGAKGPKGYQGDDGEVGPKGPDASSNSARGERGDQGEMGETGEDGERGTKGGDGDQGPTGDDGKQGHDGEEGERGDDGDGKDGDKGDKGEQGHQGSDGKEGDQGEPGHTGSDGNRGDKGPEGQEGPEGDEGQKGAPGRDGVEQNSKAGACGLQGFEGKKGEPGSDGQDGTNGRDGIDGVRGPTGAQGNKGTAGEKGNKGPEGDDAECGPNGQPGEEGDKGSRGKPGDQGVNGNDGRRGLKGPEGDDGADALDGDTGEAGIAGADGDQGKQGIPGNDGQDGEDGLTGAEGDDGPNGAAGAQGAQGEKGTKGRKGHQGQKGTADAEVLYAKIKEIVRQKMTEKGLLPCKKCVQPDPVPQKEAMPLNAVFLVDGSDSIRSG